MQIKNRYTGKVILEIDDLRGAYLPGAYLRGANLRGANLQDAYLRGANLQDAYLRGANLQDAYLPGAYLQDADLQGANLRGANLQGANLQDAYLRGAIGDGSIIRSAQYEKYHIVVCDDWLQIGCQGHRIHEWAAFTDDMIERMDDDAADLWREYKAAIFTFAGWADQL